LSGRRTYRPGRPGSSLGRSALWRSTCIADREHLYAAAASLPVGHVGETDEIDEIAQAYLCCMNQTFGTGAVITVDGGTALV
jgi:hypothetical protein